MKNLKISKFVVKCFLIIVIVNLFCFAGDNNTNPSDKLFIAVKDNNSTDAKQARDELIKMGNNAIPLLKEKIDLKNKLLTNYITNILRNIKTDDSTKVLLDLCISAQSSNRPDIVQETMWELQNRDVGMEVNEVVFNLMLGKLREDKLHFAPEAARIIGKMRKVAPELRAKPLIEALKKEISKSSDSNTPQQILMGSYTTESQYKINQYIYAIGDIGTSATPLTSKAIDTADNNNYKEYLTICLGFANDSNVLPSKIKSEIIRLAEDSTNDYTRLMAIRVLEKWKDPNLIPFFKEGLSNNYKVAVKSDRITPDMYKDAEGFYYYDYYPIRDESFSALWKLGVKVKKEGNTYKIIE